MMQLLQREAQADEERCLPISIRTASASGRTLLSAFDGALLAARVVLHEQPPSRVVPGPADPGPGALAGVANFNLIRLSSVIPRAARMDFDAAPVAGEHGDRLYCVYASAFAEHPGESAWAGIGWTRDHSGRGLFVEHHAGSEESLRELIQLSLEDMKESRGGSYGEIHSAVVSARNEGRPACALAIATYHVETWELT
jgi:arginine decarboxylase